MLLLGPGDERPGGAVPADPVEGCVGDGEIPRCSERLAGGEAMDDVEHAAVGDDQHRSVGWRRAMPSRVPVDAGRKLPQAFAAFRKGEFRIAGFKRW